MTSSARANNVGGTVRPSARAVMNRKVGWRRALQNLVDIVGGAPVQVQEVGAIGYQAAYFEELGCDRGIALRASLHPADLDRNRAARDPAALAQPLHEGIERRGTVSQNYCENVAT